MELLYWVYGICAAIGAISLIASLCGFLDVDIDGLDSMDGGYFYVIGILLYFCMGFGVGGLIWHSAGMQASLIAASICGIICAVLIKLALKGFTKLCKKSENVLPFPKVGDRGIALGDFGPVFTGQIQITHEDGSKTTCFAKSGDSVKAGQMCEILAIDGLNTVVKPLN